MTEPPKTTVLLQMECASQSDARQMCARVAAAIPGAVVQTESSIVSILVPESDERRAWGQVAGIVAI